MPFPLLVRAVSAVLVVLTCPLAFADLRVGFDAPLTAKASGKRSTRQVEVSFPVSAIVIRGSERNLREFVFHLEFLSHQARVRAITPSTTLTSPVKGDIGVEEKQETKRSAGINVAGKYPDWLRFSALADAGEKTNTNLKFQRRPSQRAIVVSGNTRRSRGAFLKFRPDLDRSLEGSQTIRVLIDVPANWDCDLLKLRCRAMSKVGKKSRICGEQQFLIAVQRDDANPTVREFIAAKRRLLRSGKKYDQRRNRQTFDNALRALTSAFSSSGVPKDWLSKVVFDGRPAPQKLPAKLRRSAARYLAARERLMK